MLLCLLQLFLFTLTFPPSPISFPQSHAYLLSPQVHMPVFFYIDPEFVDDPKMQNVEMLTLSYTFFEAREGLQLPMPQFAR